MAGREGPQYGEEVEEKVGTTRSVIAVIFIIPGLMRKFEGEEEKVVTTKIVIAVSDAVIFDHMGADENICGGIGDGKCTERMEWQ